MNENMLVVASRMSDDALVARLKALADGTRRTTVELLAHLGELAARRLYRREGPGRLFGYCTQVLRFSEAAAWNRIKAAKAARKFPAVLDLLAEGSVNLTTIRLLSPHLTLANHAAVLAEASGMTRREVDKLVARLNPKPDVPSTIRKLPSPSAATVADASNRVVSAVETGSVQPSSSVPQTIVGNAPAPVTPVSHRPLIVPLSPERYRLQLTVGEEAYDDLRVLQDLMRREIPDGNAAAIVERALKLMRKEVEHRTFAATSNPRGGRPSKTGSRHIPAAVARAVWARDGGQCAFASTSGRRCTERSYIEFHHAEPYAFGGEATVDNIALRCREHNVYESELVFGFHDASRVEETEALYGAGQ